jgi:hypothetical protein
VHQNLPYQLRSDDFAYIAGSRNWERTVDNLFVPHNTHICPSWRILTYGIVQLAGDFTHLQFVMKIVSYLALVLVMLGTGHFVAHESKSLKLGFAATALVGITSIQRLSAIWYSAGQTLWAGLFILCSLILAQEAIHRRWHWLWPGVFISCWVAGGFWTIGHAAGPVTAIYVIAASKGRSRLFAIIPATATVTAIAIVLLFGGKEIDSTTSFHGRSTSEAFDLAQGFSHTCHSIVETLILANLGIESKMTNVQAISLTLLLFVFWLNWHLSNRRAVTSLEWTGAALCISAYWVEWSFRGYFTWDSLKFIVIDWYDSIPQIGWTIFVAGWAMAASVPSGIHHDPRSWPVRMNQTDGLVIFVSGLFMLVMHQAGVDNRLIKLVPPLTNFEIENNTFPVPYLQRLRATFIWDERSKRQQRFLAKFQVAEAIAKKSGWSIADISNAFGRVRMPGIPIVYDGAFMMDLPLSSTAKANPDTVRKALEPLLKIEPDTRPPWLLKAPDLWPPKGWEDPQE